jgi:hypothetical protein
MLKKVLRLLSSYQAGRHGYRHGSSHEPWRPEKKKWKGRERDRRGGYGHPPYAPPPGYGYDHGPYGQGRPRGIKGMIIDAIVRKLLKYR